MREHWNEEWQKSVQESRVVKCYFWETAWKRAHNVVSFSKLFLRGNKQEYSASCYRLDASKIPVKNSLSDISHARPNDCVHWVLVCRSQQKAFLALFRLTWACLACYWSMDCDRDHVCHQQCRTTTWPILHRPQSGAGPACWRSLLISLNLSFGFLYRRLLPSVLGGFTTEPREGSFELGSWR